MNRQAVLALSKRIEGSVLTSEDAAYDDARRVWNGAIDRYPRLIVRCLSRSDVAEALAFAREHGIAVAVRGGGHSIAGLSTCDDGLVVDLSQMKRIDVDADNRVAFAEPGVLGGELDAATQAHGLGTTLGTISHTGIAGLTLGGGMGWAMRKFGLACDSVLSIEAVLADGTEIVASETSHPDLFWALRGGGGRFAVATRFQYELHSIGPQVAVSQFAFAAADGPAAFRVARDLAAEASEERSFWMAFVVKPDVPDQLRREGAFLIWAVSLDPADADGNWVAPLMEIGPASVESRLWDYTALQSVFDEENRHGVRAYSKGSFLKKLTDDALLTFVQQAGNAPRGVEVLAYFQQMGLAVSQQSSSVTAVQGRSADYVLNVIARWTTPEQEVDALRWARTFIRAMASHSLPVTPLNFDGDDPAEKEGASGLSTFGPALTRLREIKRRYDPGDVFGSLQRRTA